MTKSGPVLEPVVALEKVSVGEELVVRLKITSDRTYEFLELTDHQPSVPNQSKFFQAGVGQMVLVGIR